MSRHAAAEDHSRSVKESLENSSERGCYYGTKVYEIYTVVVVPNSIVNDCEALKIPNSDGCRLQCMVGVHIASHSTLVLFVTKADSHYTYKEGVSPTGVPLSARLDEILEVTKVQESGSGLCRSSLQS
ncbi:hypothetical protein J6590_061618 [Homalodisca vitripennis]|nr:hypothetical protein J6590_061618 [Homalodisca vitripennis]